MTQINSKYKLPKRIEDNIMLAFFKLSVYAGLSIYNLIDGLIDEFEDETGVDTAASTNESYDAVNDLYSPTKNTPVVSQENTVFGASHAIRNIADEALMGYRFKSVEGIDVPKIALLLHKDGNPSGNVWVEIWSDSAGNPGALITNGQSVNVACSSFNSGDWVDFSFSTKPTLINNQNYWMVLKGDYAYSVTDVVRFCRDNAHLLGWGPIHRDGDLVSPFTNTWSADDLVFKLYKAIYDNMTLLSNAVTAEAQPAKSRIVLFEEDVDACTPDTDIKAWVSRDGGTTFTQLPLVDEGDYETGKRILSSEAVNLGAQPAGSSMKWKVTTHNNKNLKLHGVAVNWD